MNYLFERLIIRLDEMIEVACEVFWVVATAAFIISVLLLLFASAYWIMS